MGIKRTTTTEVACDLCGGTPPTGEVNAAQSYDAKMYGWVALQPHHLCTSGLGHNVVAGMTPIVICSCCLNRFLDQFRPAPGPAGASDGGH